MQREVALSVIMPCLNAAAHVGRQLTALADQKLSESWELIVVENGSTDATRTIVESFRDSLPCLRLIEATEKRDRGYARNVGVQCAKGSAIVFIDADDEISPGYLETMLLALADNPVVVGRLDLGFLNEPWNRPDIGLRKGFHQSLGFLPWGVGGSLAFQREVFENLGGFHSDVPFGEDADLCWRAQLRGYELQYVVEASVRKALRHDFRAIFNQARRHARAHAFLYRKYRYAGMPRRSLAALGRDIKYFLFHMRKLRSFSDRVVWLRRLGIVAGHLQGSIQARVFYP